MKKFYTEYKGPIAAILVFIILGGLYALTNIQTSLFPDITFPKIKIIADVGLIGLPNAGKSSLLSVLTNAHPKIADYPFTTLEPNLGVMPARGALARNASHNDASGSQREAGGDGLVIADIPGLIEGASVGKGLGISFLKHVQKTKVLLHCVDPMGDDVVADYKTIRNELKTYDEELFKKPEMLVITKDDLLDKEQKIEVKKKLSKLNKNIVVVSIIDDDLLSSLKTKILGLV